MKNALLSAGFAVSMALASFAASAGVPDLQARLLATADSGDTMQQRKDVNEVSRPPPPSGPSSQNVTCSPSAPACP